MSPWSPTNKIGSGGQKLWATADPEARPTGKLAPRLEIEVVRVWGAWAEIRLENGWTGWVDNRRLAPR